ncbi:MAG: glycoside hydrolase family 127 protein [Cytophagales bacterium]|nr:glycoside hydrolase family 127 protein [Cytophagales bacterium]
MILSIVCPFPKSRCRRRLCHWGWLVLVGAATATVAQPVVRVSSRAGKVEAPVELLSPRDVTLAGWLGAAAEASRKGRLHHFITDERSEMIALFSPQARAGNTEGDWKGEHAGKWLYTAARAACRTGDTTLLANARKVADYLVRVQEPDGYLGTYSPRTRLTSDEAYRKVKTWDVWVHSYLMLGLLEMHQYRPTPAYLDAVKKMAGLCMDQFADGKKDITWMGNHFGLSSTILLEPMVALYAATADPRYLRFCNVIVGQMEARKELEIIGRNLKGADASGVGDGKIYQVLWNYVALARLYEATGNADYLKAVRHGWQSVKDDHLTLEGGPWGGIGISNTEMFNAKGYFNPNGFVETCSIMSWIQLNRELLRLTGEAVYAEEAEKAMYNALLGAQDPNGHDWNYFIFPNGRRTNTFDWACCKSSGALALEEAGPLSYGKREGGIAVHLYSPGEATLRLPATGQTKVVQATTYPTGEDVILTLHPARPAHFPLFVRIPSWAEGARVAVNGESAGPATPGTYARISRRWKRGDVVSLHLPMPVQVHQKSQITHEKHTEVVRLDYVALTRGPLVYATGLIDGYKREETVQLPGQHPDQLVTPAATPAGFNGPAVSLSLPGRRPIVFLPYYEAGGRKDGAWRITWLPSVVR